MKNYWLEKRAQKSPQKGGFPTDDEFSLQQLSSGDCSLEIWYNLQFVQNEVLTPIFPFEKRDNLTLDHVAVAGTMTGTVYLENKAIQTFVVMTNGNAVFQDACDYPALLAKSKTKVTSILLNLHTGEISFVWNEKPDDHSYVVSYEYSVECGDGFDPNQ